MEPYLLIAKKIAKLTKPDIQNSFVRKSIETHLIYER